MGNIIRCFSLNVKEIFPLTPDFTGARWFKSSVSGPTGGNCVEVAHLPGGLVGLRDSKDQGKTPYTFSRDEWQAFLDGARNGEFDLPA
jgi:Domain of unknown function (DUF397)